MFTWKSIESTRKLMTKFVILWTANDGVTSKVARRIWWTWTINAGGDTINFLEYVGETLLPKDLFSKWDDKADSEVEAKTKHDAGAQISVKSDDRVRLEQEGKPPDFIGRGRKSQWWRRKRPSRPNFYLESVNNRSTIDGSALIPLDNHLDLEWNVEHPRLYSRNMMLLTLSVFECRINRKSSDFEKLIPSMITLKKW